MRQVAVVLECEIFGGKSGVLDETLHSYFTDADRSDHTRELDISNELERMYKKAKQSKDEFMAMVKSVNVDDVYILTQDIIRLIKMASSINYHMPKDADCPKYALDRNNREYRPSLIHLNDKCWKLKERIYQIKYDIVEQILILLRDNPSVPIDIEFKYHHAECTRVLNFHFDGQRIRGFHMPVKIDDFILNNYNMVWFNDNLRLRPSEDQSIWIRNGKAGFGKERTEQIEKAKAARNKNEEAKEKIVNGLFKDKIMVAPFGDRNLPCLIKVKAKGVVGDYFYNVVSDGNHYTNYMVNVPGTNRVIRFDSYAYDKNFIYLSGEGYTAEVNRNGRVTVVAD